jgi:hypothetical protein
LDYPQRDAVLFALRKLENANLVAQNEFNRAE